MYVKKFVVGIFQSNVYIVSKEKDSKEAFMIDCGDLSNEMLNYIKNNNIKISAIFLTHGHFDHIGAVKYFKDMGIKIYSHKNENDKIECKDNSTNILNLKLEPFKADFNINDNDEFKIADIKVKVLFTPGHSSGSCSFLVDDEILFTGDTLFKESFGRYDFNDSDFYALKNSLNKIFNLKKDYLIYPGHGEETTLFYEKKNNPFNYYL